MKHLGPLMMSDFDQTWYVTTTHDVLSEMTKKIGRSAVVAIKRHLRRPPQAVLKPLMVSDFYKT